MKQYPLNETEQIHDMRHLVARSARLFPDRIAFAELARSDAMVSVSYSRFERDVHALGTALLSKGFQGKRIALIGENSYAWVLAYFAIINSGITVVPFDKELSLAEVVDQMRRADVDAVCHTGAYTTEAHEAVGILEGGRDKRIVCINLGSLAEGGLVPSYLKKGYEEIESSSDLYEGVDLDVGATCSILFTSGTTGTSKGVMLSHKGLAANTVSAGQLVFAYPEDSLLSVLPIHHSYEDMCGIFTPLYYGTMIALCPEIKKLPHYLSAFNPTIMCLVPLYLETFHGRIIKAAQDQGKERLFKYTMGLVSKLQRMGIDVSSKLLSAPREALGGRLRIIICGGAPLDPSYVSFYRTLGIQILEGYGITECSPLVSANRNEDYKDGSVGRVAPCADIRFDEEGQLFVKGPLVMNGYLDDEEATREAIVGGWFATGDIGYLDKDGFLHITGRCKDIIVLSNGKNVMPHEVESALTAQKSIAEAVVIAGPATANGSDCLVAHIYADPESGDEETALSRVREDIKQVNRGLVYYKRIAGFTLHKEPFEKTTTRKVKRFLLFGDVEGMQDV